MVQRLNSNSSRTANFRYLRVGDLDFMRIKNLKSYKGFDRE